ncbi:MAG: alpha/beta hydrolase [Pseudomonadota bacterium]|nr:alpha/beta hydrolase [Pseudomonadota bacterium]
MPRGYVDTSLTQVHYVREGAGASLLLLAASGRSSRMFAGLMDILAPHFDVCALDTPGFGNSGPLRPGTTIEQLAECVVQVMNGLRIERTHLYGLHTGNKIATALAGRWPDRVARLVLAGQSHSLIPDRARRNATILEIVREYLEPPVPGPAAELADWAAAFQRLGAIWWDHHLIATGATAEGRVHARNLALDELQSGGTANLYRANFAYDLGRGFTDIAAPTLILEIATPEEDRTIGRQGPAVQRLIPGATLQTMTEPRGHTLTLENRARDLADILVAVLRPAL